MQAKLVVVSGRANRREITLKLPLSVGRSKDQKLAILHPTVSRKHCELFERNGLLYVRDDGSANGTFVGESRVQGEMAVRPGQRLTIGPLVFEAVYQTAPVDASLAQTLPGDDLAALAAADALAETPGDDTLVAPAAHLAIDDLALDDVSGDDLSLDFDAPAETPAKTPAASNDDNLLGLDDDFDLSLGEPEAPVASAKPLTTPAEPDELALDDVSADDLALDFDAIEEKPAAALAPPMPPAVGDDDLLALDDDFGLSLDEPESPVVNAAPPTPQPEPEELSLDEIVDVEPAPPMAEVGGGELALDEDDLSIDFDDDELSRAVAQELKSAPEPSAAVNEPKQDSSDNWLPLDLLDEMASDSEELALEDSPAEFASDTAAAPIDAGSTPDGDDLMLELGDDFSLDDELEVAGPVETTPEQKTNDAGPSAMLPVDLVDDPELTLDDDLPLPLAPPAAAALSEASDSESEETEGADEQPGVAQEEESLASLEMDLDNDALALADDALAIDLETDAPLDLAPSAAPPAALPLEPIADLDLEPIADELAISDELAIEPLDAAPDGAPEPTDFPMDDLAPLAPLDELEPLAELESPEDESALTISDMDEPTPLDTLAPPVIEDLAPLAPLDELEPLTSIDEPLSEFEADELDLDSPLTPQASLVEPELTLLPAPDEVVKDEALAPLELADELDLDLDVEEAGEPLALESIDDNPPIALEPSTEDEPDFELDQAPAEFDPPQAALPAAADDDAEFAALEALGLDDSPPPTELKSIEEFQEFEPEASAMATDAPNVEADLDDAIEPGAASDLDDIGQFDLDQPRESLDLTSDLPDDDARALSLGDADFVLEDDLSAAVAAGAEPSFHGSPDAHAASDSEPAVALVEAIEAPQKAKRSLFGFLSLKRKPKQPKPAKPAKKGKSKPAAPAAAEAPIVALEEAVAATPLQEKGPAHSGPVAPLTYSQEAEDFIFSTLDDGERPAPPAETAPLVDDMEISFDEPLNLDEPEAATPAVGLTDNTASDVTVSSAAPVAEVVATSAAPAKPTFWQRLIAALKIKSKPRKPKAPKPPKVAKVAKPEKPSKKKAKPKAIEESALDIPSPYFGNEADDAPAPLPMEEPESLGQSDDGLPDFDFEPAEPVSKNGSHAAHKKQLSEADLDDLLNP